MCVINVSYFPPQPRKNSNRDDGREPDFAGAHPIGAIQDRCSVILNAAAFNPHADRFAFRALRWRRPAECLLIHFVASLPGPIVRPGTPE